MIPPTLFMTLVFVVLIAPMTYGYGQAKPIMIDRDTQYKSVDGDTIKFRRKGGQWQTVRILDLDTPESWRSRCEREKHWGLMAKQRLSELLTCDVEIKYKLYSRGRKKGKPIKGKYGRWLASVYSDGRSVAETLISEELGRFYSGRSRRQGWCDNDSVLAYRAAVKIFKRGR